MMQEIAWKLGGQQGEGFESAGELLARGLIFPTRRITPLILIMRHGHFTPANC